MRVVTSRNNTVLDLVTLYNEDLVICLLNCAENSDRPPSYYNKDCMPCLLVM